MKTTSEKKLYPIGALIRRGHIEVSDNASIYFEERGNPYGPAVVYNHGGPGDASCPECSQWFDPDYYHIILYDQRGTGRSLPSVQNKNIASDYFKDLTIDEMVADLEILRQSLNIPKWLVFGGSWGSTLSLYYSEKHPEAVTGLVVRGIFLNTKEEMDEYYHLNFIRKRFPQLGESAMMELQHYAASQGYSIDPYNACSFVKAYYDLCVLKDDPVAQYLWTAYEEFNDDPTSQSLERLKQRPSRESLEGIYRTTAIFECTLFRYAFEGFNILDENLLRQLKNINTYIVQGKQDTEAPPTYAEKLVNALLKIKSDLHYQFVEGRHSGGSSSEMTTALIESTDAFKKPIPVNTAEVITAITKPGFFQPCNDKVNSVDVLKQTPKNLQTMLTNKF